MNLNRQEIARRLPSWLARFAMAATVALSLALGAQGAGAATTAKPNEPAAACQHMAQAGTGPFEKVADLLGLKPDEIRQRFARGESLADIAADEGIGRDELTRTIENAVSDRLDQAEKAGFLTADERNTLDDLVSSHIDRLIDANRADFRQHMSELAAAHQELADKVGDLLGLKPEEIAQRIRGGDSLAEIAADQGVDRDKLVGTIDDAVAEHLDQAVKDGKLTAEQRDTIDELVSSHVDRLVDFHPGDCLGHAGNGDDTDKGGQTDNDDKEASSTTMLPAVF